MGATLAIVNLADSATLSTTSGTMLLPLTQLQVPWARGLARGPSNYTSGTTALVLRADLGSAKDFVCLGIAGLNDAVAAAPDVRYSNTAFGNTDRGTATMANDGLNGDTHGNSMWTVGAVYCRYIEIYIEVYALPLGLRYVDARRLLIMQAGCLLSDGVDFDWSLTHIDQSTAQVTPRGGVFTDTQGTFRELKFGVSGMTATEAEDLRTWIAAARKTTEIVVSLRDEGAVALQSNRTIYGRLVSWSPIEHQGGDYYKCDSITVHETPYPAL